MISPNRHDEQILLKKNASRLEHIGGALLFLAGW
jgi:hypothetical protein